MEDQDIREQVSSLTHTLGLLYYIMLMIYPQSFCKIASLVDSWSLSSLQVRWVELIT